jgi:eukaryotic-like serine/threonine-protein kinase
VSRGDVGGTLGVIAEPAQLGRYRLLRKIAVGGMAEIYLARVSGAGGFEKDVVVKRILPQLAESDEIFAMFLDEARIAAALQHPNLVQVFDAGQAGNEYFIAMEYLDGADLQTVRRVLAERQRGMPLQHGIFIVSSIAAGLHHAHEKRGLDGSPLEIVHRDVTPQNVFLTREGGVKLVDFGIAKAINRMATTSHGTLKGKLAYMSPEQCRAEPVDRRSDVYSLGILLYELTTGRRPYRGKSEYELLREIVEGEVPPPSHTVSGYPADLEAIAMRALARDRDERLPSALALVQELERFARRHSLVGSTLALRRPGRAAAERARAGPGAGAVRAPALAGRLDPGAGRVPGAAAGRGAAPVGGAPPAPDEHRAAALRGAGAGGSGAVDRALDGRAVVRKRGGPARHGRGDLSAPAGPAEQLAPGHRRS